MKNRSLLLAAALSCATSSTFAQHVVAWDASSGQLPSDAVPNWERFLETTACSAVLEDLQPTYLELDNTSACVDDLLTYTSISPGLLPVPPGGIYRAETRCQVVQSGDVDPNNGVATLILAQPYTCPWILDIERDSISFSYGTELNVTFPMDTTDGMHDYRIESEAWSFEGRAYVDGQLIGTVTTTQSFCGQFHQTLSGALVGQKAATEPGITRWESMSHNTGRPVEYFCTTAPNPNSLGLTAWLTPMGSLSVIDEDFRLHATGVPVGSFGYFLCSRDPAPATPLLGSQGALCLGGSIGRFNRSGEILVATHQTMMSLEVDLMDLPQPTGAVSVQSGDTWHFQLWYRDANPMPTSNLSNGALVHFQ